MEIESELVNADAFVGYIPGRSMVVSAGVGARPSNKNLVPTSPKLKEETNEVAIWGDDNLFPQVVYKEAIKPSTIIGPTLDLKARIAYGSGLEWGIIEEDENGKEKFKKGTHKTHPEVHAFLRQSNINRYLIEAFKDMFWFYNCFPEFVLSKDRKKINFLTLQDALDCRWAKQDSNGIVQKCFISGKWEDNGGAYKVDDCTTVAVVDPYFDPVTAVKEGKEYKYIYPTSYPTPGAKYYSLADWNAVRESKWLDVAQLIPKFKKAFLENQMTVKYHVKVNVKWFEWKHPKWESKKDSEKKAIFTEELKRFNDFLTGVENAGRSILSIYKDDPITKEKWEGWDIIAIDDKVKSGMYVEDSQEASSHLLYACGVDPTIPGHSPGRGQGSGSGSDKREAINIFTSFITPHIDLVLEPLNFIRDYNGWDPDLVFRIKRPLLQTLDKVTPDNRETINANK